MEKIKEQANLSSVDIPTDIVVPTDKDDAESLYECFVHNCEHGIFPYFTERERNDHSYWFPTWFKRVGAGAWKVYLMNLHPNPSKKYAARVVRDGDPQEVHFLKTRKRYESGIPLPKELMNEDEDEDQGEDD